MTSSNTALVANSGITLNAAKTALQIGTVAGQQGTTTITLTDERGVTRDVPVRVAYTAGSIGGSLAR